MAYAILIMLDILIIKMCSIIWKCHIYHKLFLVIGRKIQGIYIHVYMSTTCSRHLGSMDESYYVLHFKKGAFVTYNDILVIKVIRKSEILALGTVKVSSVILLVYSPNAKY